MHSSRSAHRTVGSRTSLTAALSLRYLCDRGPAHSACEQMGADTPVHMHASVPASSLHDHEGAVADACVHAAVSFLSCCAASVGVPYTH